MSKNNEIALFKLIKRLTKLGAKNSFKCGNVVF